MIVKIAYFSGTGSTRHTVETFRLEMEARGNTVLIQHIKAGVPLLSDPYELLILLFPVYASNAPHPVEEWVRQNPLSEGMPAAVISVSGGGSITPNLACRVGIKKLLKKKKFNVFYENMIVMPSNWIFGTHRSAINRLLEVLPSRVTEMTTSIVNGKKHLIHAGPVNRIISVLCRLERVGARLFGENIKVQSSCTGCGLCEKKCPAGNIQLENDLPRFSKGCVLCLSCIYSCPVSALSPGVGGFFIIPEGFDFDRIVRDQASSDLKEGEPKGLLWMGLRRYIKESEYES